MSADHDDHYTIQLDDKFGKMALVDVAGEAAAHEPWFNQTLTTVNDSVVITVVRIKRYQIDIHHRQTRHHQTTQRTNVGR